MLMLPNRELDTTPPHGLRCTMIAVHILFRRYEKTSHVGGGFTAETAPEVLPESRLLNVHVTVDQEEEIYFPALPDHNDTGEPLCVLVQLACLLCA